MQRIASDDVQPVVGLGHDGGQRRAWRQATHLESAVRPRPERVELALHLEPDLPGARPALAHHVVSVAMPDQDVLRRLALEGHRQVSRHQQQGAEGDRLARTQDSIGEDPGRHGQERNQGGIGAVPRRRCLVVEQEVLGQVEDQQRSHAVVGKAFPRLGEEQDRQAAWMAA